MNMNRLSIRRLLGPLAMALSVVVIVAGTLQWPLGVVYALLAAMLVVVLAARRAAHDDRRAR